MTVEATPALGVDDEVGPVLQPHRAAAVDSLPFAQLLGRGVEAVNQRLLASESQLQGVAIGEPVSLHRLMIGLEESRVALQLMLQVRNRLLESYQEVMRMQV
jgi:flagellar hook-basal body complex protein FliE